jgi:Fe-S oxidoreductase
MAKLKAEFMQHYHDKKGVALSTWLIANIARVHKINSVMPWLYNSMMKSALITGAVKKVMGFAEQRTLPLLSQKSFEKWLRQSNYLANGKAVISNGRPEVYFFLDEFTNYLDAEIGIAAIKVLSRFNYNIRIIPSKESGRTFISKGLLRKAKKIAEYNVAKFNGIIHENCVLIGIEPSAILTFRDEYPDLVMPSMREDARKLAANTFMFDEFITREFNAGRIDRSMFTDAPRKVKFHGHCQQKAVASTASTKNMLSIPQNYSVEEIKSGCCGMAGAFGYEKRHYDVSMKIGELVLFPAVRNSEPGTIICAPGNSCRQQILDGTAVEALHPAVVLYQALRD